MSEIISTTSKDLLDTESRLQKIENDNKSSEILFQESKLIISWLFSKNEKTRQSYEIDIKKFFEFYQDMGLGLKNLTEIHISLYIKQNSYLKKSTLLRKKSAISSLLKFCVKKGYLDKNPSELLDSIKVPDQTQFRVLAHEEILRMLDRGKLEKQNHFKNSL